MRKLKWLEAGLICLLSGCSLINKGEQVEDLSAEELYAAAQENLEDRNWNTAIEKLRELKAKYPNGKYAVQAHLDTIYAYYKNREPGLAIASADRFIKLNPTHYSVDYAYYLKGLSSYEEDKSFLGRWSGQNDLSNRDASLARRAMKAFEEVYMLFQDSKYAPDARLRAKYLLNTLARHELGVANYYYSRGAYVAVVKRAKGIIEDYSNTNSIEEALALLMLSYESMGLEELYQDSRRVLELSFPGSVYLAQTDNNNIRLSNINMEDEEEEQG